MTPNLPGNASREKNFARVSPRAVGLRMVMGIDGDDANFGVSAPVVVRPLVFVARLGGIGPAAWDWCECLRKSAVGDRNGGSAGP